MNHGDVSRVNCQPTLDILTNLEEERERRGGVSRKVVVLDLVITLERSSHTAVKQQRIVLFFCQIEYAVVFVIVGFQEGGDDFPVVCLSFHLPAAWIPWEAHR